MGQIATWGSHTITEEELTSIKFSYGLRLAKLKTVYENPIIQYVGKDVITVEINLTTSNEQKIYDIWNEKQALTASIRNLTIGGTNYGDFYLNNTEIDYQTINYQSDDNGFRIIESTLIQAKIKLQGVQEMPI